MKISITKKIFVLLFLTAIGVLLTFAIFYQYHHKVENDNAYINVAGHQRMLSKQLYIYADMVHIGQEEDRPLLRETVATFDYALDILEKGGEVMAFHLLPPPVEVVKVITENRKIWTSYKKAALLIADQPTDDSEALQAYEYIANNTQALTEFSNSIVTTMQEFGDAQYRQMVFVMIVIATIDFLLLLFSLKIIKQYVTDNKQHEGLLQDIVDQSQRQLTALSEANVRMALISAGSEVLQDADKVLQDSGDVKEFYEKVITELMEVSAARYGAIFTFDKNGHPSDFISRGFSEEHMAKLGDKPVGKGLLKEIFEGNSITRVDNMQEDTGSCRFHPDMKSLIGMPILVNDNIQCAIYLTDKNGGEPFTDNDEFILKMFSRDIEHVLERTGLMQALQKDITDRKLAEIELNNSHMELKEAYKRLKNTQDQLLQSEKMASIGQLAAGVAHEINNPVAFVYSNLSTMQKYTGKLLDVLDTYKKADPFLSACPEDVSNEIQQIKEQVDLNFIVEDLPELVSESREGLSRVKQIVQDLKDFSRVDSAEVEWADLHNGLDSTLNIVNNEIKYKAEVVKEYGELPQVECRASQINQVFLNLLVNAGHAIEKQGTITIKTGAKDEWVWIEIADTGKGILPEDMNKLFEPFFTTKPMGTGTGLGLSLSYGIVNAHEGRIEVESEVGKGTTFTVWLPVKQEDKHGDLDNETQASAIA